MACTKTISHVEVSKMFLLVTTTSLVTEWTVLVINDSLVSEVYRYYREKILLPSDQPMTSYTNTYVSTNRPRGEEHKKIYNKKQKCFNRYRLFLKLNQSSYLSDNLCILQKKTIFLYIYWDGRLPSNFLKKFTVLFINVC